MIQKPRGTSDYLGSEFKRRRDIENKFVDFFVNKGYRGLETPMFESRDLFVRSVGEGTDIIKKELFNLEKKSDNIYSLRPEFTAGVIRSLIENGIKSMKLPVKVFSLGPCFRYERPQKGRKRQFNQLNLELIGKKDPGLDGEFISDVAEFLRSIGLGSVIININSLGSQKTKENYTLELKEYLSGKSNELCVLCKERVKKNTLRVLDCKEEKCHEIVTSAPSISESLSEEEKEYYDEVKNYLKEKEIYYLEDPTLARGLDYYTGIIFEVNLEEDKSRMASLGGGGRYDNLISALGGVEMPAMGVGLGFERIAEFLKN